MKRIKATSLKDIEDLQKQVAEEADNIRAQKEAERERLKEKLPTLEKRVKVVKQRIKALDAELA